MNDTVITALITGVVAVIGSWLVYKGGKRTADASKTAAKDTTRVDAQADALEAWKALLKPVQEELETVRQALNKERSDRNEESERITDEQAAQRRQMERLQSEVTRWQQVAKTIARWATQLRDEVLRLGGSVPATPEELLTLQAIDEAADERAG